MKAIADSSALIHPAKIPSFWNAMKNTFEEILIPEAVHREILKGKEFDSADVPIIEKEIAEGWIKVVRTRTKLELPDVLGAGEKEAISLMDQLRGAGSIWLLIDDEIAARTARSIGLETRPVSYLPIYWKMKKTFSSLEAIRMLDELILVGYRLGASDYVTIKKVLS